MAPHVVPDVPRVPHTAVPSQRPPSAVELGVSSGALDPELRVTSSNWIDPPFNRWGYSHVRELTRTAPVGRGRQRVWDLADQTLDLGVVTFRHDGRTFTYKEAMAATYSDAVVVLHGGKVVFEHYDRGMHADRTHLLMSVSKSLTATLIGVLVGQGLVATEATVETYLPQLAGTAWEGCTVQHLLDMRGGIAFDEHDMDDPESDGCVLEQISGYTLVVGDAHQRPHLPANTVEWIRALPARPPHGGPFEYRSILTDVLGWIAEAVTGERFADAFSRFVWSQLGAEHDADLIVDSAGFAVVEGGFCVTARDLARFGQMHLQRGVVDGVQVVPAAWIDRVVDRDQELIDTFAASYDADPSNTEAYYHDCWWVWDAALGRYGGYGLGGQNLLVDRTSDTVVVKLSSWPKRMDPLLAALADAAHAALFAHLAAP